MRQAGAKVAFLTVLVLLLVLGGAYAGLYLHAGDRAPRGAAVEGVPLGGLTAAQAADRLRSQLAARAAAPVLVTYGDGRTARVAPEEAGLSVDWDASVAVAGASQDVRLSRLWAAVAGGSNHRAVVRVDPVRMRAALDALGRGVSDRPVEPAVRFVDGRPVLARGHAGVVVSRSRAQSLITRRYLRAGSEKLPLELVPPTVDVTEIRRFLADFARPAMSGPVSVVVAGHRVTAPARLVGGALGTRVVAGRLVPTVDVDRLLDDLSPMLPHLARESRDARVELRGGAPSVVPAVTGLAVEPDAAERGLLAALVRHGAARRVALTGTLSQPEFSTAQASALGVRRQVGRTTRWVPSGTAEVLSAARGINGLLLRPRQVLTPPVGPAVLRSALAQAARQTGLRAAGGRFVNDSRYGVLVSVQVRPPSAHRRGVLTVSMWSTPHQRA